MMKKLFFAAFLGLIFFAACKKDAGVGPNTVRDDNTFVLYETHFLEGLWKLDPDMATQNGFHKYDSLLVIPTEKARQAMLSYVRLQNDSLSHWETGRLNDANRMDYQIIQNQLDYITWRITVLKQNEWDPSAYNVIGTFAYILNGHYAPLEKRLRNFYEKMAEVPAYYKQVQKELKNPVAELTALAIEQHENGLDVMEKDFADSLKRTKISESEQKKMLERAHTAVTAIKDYTAFLKSMKNDHPRGFRLGKDFYEDKFKYEQQITANALQTYNAAVTRKKFIHSEMTKLTRQLWPKYFGKKATPNDSLAMIAEMMDTLSGKHAKAADFQSSIVDLMPKLTAFVKNKDLVTLDPAKSLIVRKTPGYMSGVAVASMSPPGAYDKNGNYYFDVENLAGIAPDKAESMLREYNQYTIQWLCIHEGVPGHYVQQVAALKSPSLIKSIFGNTAMVEGWAVYAEQMMLDADYGNVPEMKLMWYKWHLRSVCNTILDYSVHTRDMPKDAAIALLTKEAFQQQAEAEGKWKRVSLSSVQLDSYYAGYKEIMDLRDAYKQKMGDKFKVKEFNDKFLSYGNAPVKYIRGAMLGTK